MMRDEKHLAMQDELRSFLLRWRAKYQQADAGGVLAALGLEMANIAHAHDLGPEEPIACYIMAATAAYPKDEAAIIDFLRESGGLFRTWDGPETEPDCG